MKDIFTDMQAKIGCPYLSDLPYYKRAVWFEMKRLCLSDYPKKQLEDFSRYVFGVPYAVIQEAVTKKGRDETWKKCVFRLKHESRQTEKSELFGSPCLSTQNRWKNCWGLMLIQTITLSRARNFLC
ncbi:conjugal transfer protein [Coprobacillaceae bacterium CR2/5/TPMF4]|nr:conjugal transfer protein [Coprobacillaceae bacterium CR2/5/TPMF4]